jgi:glucose-specific phosphotransferase system IIA component
VALTVAAPLAGTAIALEEVPDPVFATAIVGPGMAIEPDPRVGVVTAPIAGQLLKVKPHAFVVVSPEGQAVLVHLGIDTVSLNGEGFTVLAAEGTPVAAGDPVIEWDPVTIAERGLSTVCPIIALDAERVLNTATGPILAGEPVFTWP